MSGNSSELFIEGLPGSLSQEESDKLFKMARQGDKEARNELILHNVKLVMYEVKKRFCFAGFDVEDLVSVGNIGLIKAVETFDREKGFNFSSYATRCIDNEILMYLNKSRSEKVDTSLDKPVVGGHNDDEMDIMDTIKDNTDIVNEWLAKERLQIIREAVEKLPEQGREIIKLYFGFYNNKTYTQNEISRILSISQSEVSKKIKLFLSDLNVTLYNEGVIEKNYFENRSRNKRERIVSKIKVKSIYEHFSSYEKEQVDAALEELTDEEKRLIALRYGDNLENPISNKMDPKEINAFYYKLLGKMKKKLALAELFKTQEFIDKTSEYSTDEKVVKALNEGYIDGKHCSLSTIAKFLDIEKDEAAKLLEKVETLDANGKEKSVKTNRTVKSIYEYFSSYTKEQINSVLEDLTDEEKRLITLRYGEDLENPISSEMNAKETNAFYYTLFRKMKKKLALAELLKTQDFINETTEYSTAERIVKALKGGYIDGTHCSLSTIASVLGIEKEEAARLLKNVEVLDAKRRVQTSENISRTDLPVLSKKLVNERNLKV
mgnify:FL=1